MIPDRYYSTKFVFSSKNAQKQLEKTRIRFKPKFENAWKKYFLVFYHFFTTSNKM